MNDIPLCLQSSIKPLGKVHYLTFFLVKKKDQPILYKQGHDC